MELRLSAEHTAFTHRDNLSMTYGKWLGQIRRIRSSRSEKRVEIIRLKKES